MNRSCHCGLAGVPVTVSETTNSDRLKARHQGSRAGIDSESEVLSGRALIVGFGAFVAYQRNGCQFSQASGVLAKGSLQFRDHALQFTSVRVQSLGTQIADAVLEPPLQGGVQNPLRIAPFST